MKKLALAAFAAAVLGSGVPARAGDVPPLPRNALDVICDTIGHDVWVGTFRVIDCVPYGD